MLRYSILFFCFLWFTACPRPGTIPTTDDPPVSDETPDPEEIAGNATFEYWLHSPIHPQNKQSVSFSLKANDPAGISRVELGIYEFELFKNELGLPSKRQRPGGTYGILESWELDVPKTDIEKSFFYPDGFPAKTNIEYIFTITNIKGEVSRKMAIFDAGDPPWPNDKILLYATSRQPLDKTINLCFFADTDYGGIWSRFLADVEQLIYNGYHENNQIRNNKDQWAFYYTPQESDGMAMANDFFNPDRYPPFMKDSLIPGIDAFGLLHRETYSDGAYLNSNIQFLAQNVFTSEGYNWGTAIHETAHAVFHLSDEYNGCACFGSGASSNVFPSLTECQRYNQRKGFPISDCTEIMGYDGRGWFLSEKPLLFPTLEACQQYNVEQGLPKDSCYLFIDFTSEQGYKPFEGVCIMHDDGDRRVPIFRHACSAVIQDFYQNLRPDAPTTETTVPTERVDNLFGYEPVIVLELIAGKETEIQVKNIRYGVPTKNIIRKGDIQLDFPALGKATPNYQLSIDRPDCVHIHHGKKEADVLINPQPNSRCTVMVPMLEDLSDIICKEVKFGKSTEEHRVNIRKQLLQKIRDFKRKKN